MEDRAEVEVVVHVELRSEANLEVAHAFVEGVLGELERDALEGLGVA